jgi:class 3 adenylate cyclase/tetratricopeptide (TPR) repeat protein
MFVDLVGSTALSAELDPEDYRAVVQQYHQTCNTILQRHAGHVAQPLGDGLLVYFGHPVAHEDDAQRAVRAGLEIIEALQQRFPSPFQGEGGTSRARAGEGSQKTPTQEPPLPLPTGARDLKSLPVRIGIHTGLVVIGEIGASEKKELLALGETPNLAARIQGLAEPNTVLISAATQRLISSQFECQPFGSHLVKGIAAPIAVYHVQSERPQVSPLAGKGALTPLVGREQELGLLLDRWEQVKEGHGHVILLSGEPGIGKSRLAYTLREHVTQDGSLLFEARCSPYHQQSALYPLIDLLQRTLLFTRQDTEAEKVAKLEQALALYELQDTLPLFTALLSLPTPADAPPLHLTPQKQKERTLQALLQLFLAQAERQATVLVWEDLHWADPSSLEFLSLLIDQLPTAKLLLVLTYRPEFIPPWKPRSHLSHLVLNRLGQKQVEAMITQAATSHQLTPEVIAQIRLKTDGVPLFVEELTKSVLEAEASPHAAPLHLAIPSTLQDALMARLDRLADARPIAQLGATLGREFSYELLHAVSEVSRPYLLALLVEGYEKTGQVEEELSSLAEALATVDRSGERWYEAELYRLKGELTFQSSVQSLESRVEEAEECFLKAINVAREQQAKSLELRASTSLARLWQRQGKHHAARTLLSEIYHWFTEGFDTKDLQEAQALLKELP